MFRVGDMRHHSSLVGANLSVQLVQRKVTAEGEIFDEVIPIKVSPDSNEQVLNSREINNNENGFKKRFFFI